MMFDPPLLSFHSRHPCYHPFGWKGLGRTLFPIEAVLGNYMLYVPYYLFSLLFL
jgi:hypothetical protein